MAITPITHKQAAQEKMLYGLFLDLFCSCEVCQEYVDQLTDDLKSAKASAKKIKKSLEAVKAQYVVLNGSLPREPK